MHILLLQNLFNSLKGVYTIQIIQRRCSNTHVSIFYAGYFWLIMLALSLYSHVISQLPPPQNRLVIHIISSISSCKARIHPTIISITICISTCRLQITLWICSISRRLLQHQRPQRPTTKLLEAFSPLMIISHIPWLQIHCPTMSMSCRTWSICINMLGLPHPVIPIAAWTALDQISWQSLRNVIKLIIR